MGKAALRAALCCALGAFWCAPAAAAQQQPARLAAPRSAVLLVLDASQAMHGAKLRAAKAALVSGVRSLPAGTPVGLRVYGGGSGASKQVAECGSHTRFALRPAPRDPAAMRAALSDVQSGGRSPLGLALRRAAQDLPPGPDSTAVVVAAGADDCSAAPPCQTATSARGTPPVRADVIGLEVGAEARRALQCTARASGGVYTDARTTGALARELRAALGRATRDRRSLGARVAGGLERAQATPVHRGEYVDTIAPDSERWYSLDVPAGREGSVAATIAAAPAGDVSAPGSSLTLDGVGPVSFTAPSASNLFAFEPDRSVTVSTASPLRPGRYAVRVSLQDSPDGQLAKKLHGGELPLELVFDVPRARPRPVVQPPRHGAGGGSGSSRVSWGAAAAALIGCALIAFTAVRYVRRPAPEGPE